ncbi:Phosphoribosylformylglycinamidine synthase 2 [compost metagenome]
MLDGVLAAIQKGLVQSAHDLSEGGLAVALAESCISGNLGAKVNFTTELRSDIALFSESQSRILLSASPDKAAELEQLIASYGVPVQKIGQVTGRNLDISVGACSVLSRPVSELKQVWEDVIPCLMQ